MHAWFGGLWRHPDFLRLWAGQTVSLCGSAFTALALPLTAVLVLGATPWEMGVLAAIGGAPWFLFGPFAGVWVDRVRRRPLLIGADLARAFLLGTIPLAAALGVLRLGQLYLIAFPIGVASALFAIAQQSYLPTLVTREHLVEGNSKLSASLTAANVAAPGLAGGVVQLLSAPLAILVDAASFLVSAACLRAIRTPEPAPIVAAGSADVGAQIREGLRFTRDNPYIRAFTATNVAFFCCNGIVDTVLLLYLARDLGLSAPVIGLILGTGSGGGLAGALLAAPLTARWGLGPTLLWSATLRGAGLLALPLAGSLPVGVVPVLVAGQLVTSGGWSVFFVNQTSLRQALVPDRLLGRVNASFWMVVRGAVPLGALLGGLLGTQFGLRATLLVGAVGALCSGFFLLRSPVGALRAQPSPSENGPPA
jgi:MFS family permease